MGANENTIAVLKGGNHLDYKKLFVDEDGNLYVRGSIQTSGLSNAIRVTTMEITDTESPIPAIALPGRNAMKISNLDSDETIYFGPTGVTADRVVGITSGDEIGPESDYQIDISDAVILYGRAETGKTILIKVTEVS